MNLLLYIYFFLNLISIILTEYVEPCLAAQECQYSGKTIPCSEHGICFYDIYKYVSEDSTNKNFIDCICDEGFITKDENDSIKCCYEQKLQKYAILLEILPLGFGHYYSGRIINFVIKLIFQSIIILYMLFYSLCCQNFDKIRKYRGYELLSNDSKKNDYINNLKSKIDTGRMVTVAIYICTFIIMIIWQCLDIFLFGLNVYTDGNSVKLKKW
jgi:hypothetical protein